MTPNTNENSQNQGCSFEKTKKCLAFLAFTLSALYLLGTIFVTLYFAKSSQLCLSIQKCENKVNIHGCIIEEQLYCCGTQGHYSCGSYTNCLFQGDYFNDCSNRPVIMWAMGLTSLPLFVWIFLRSKINAKSKGQKLQSLQI